jgi:transcriptional regulator with GAF, ATPase, and Fis domain
MAAGAQEAGSESLKVESVFVLLADTLAADFDLNDVLDQLTLACVQLLGATAAGILLNADGGELRVIAASDESSHLLEVFQLQSKAGPCLDAFSSGSPVAVADLMAASARWPDFASRAGALGFRAVHAFPMRLRTEVIGAINLFHDKPTTMSASYAGIAQALADVSTISVLQLRATKDREQVAEQLQLALTSRIVIEQAKGVLSEVGKIDMGQAFAALRRYARDRNLRLTGVAERIVSRDLDAAELLAAAQRRRP